VEIPIFPCEVDRSSLSFKAAVEVQPEIVLPKYKGVKLEFKKIAVPADEIKRQMDSIKESRKVEALDDSFARSVGYPSMAEFEKAVVRQLEVQKDTRSATRSKNRFWIQSPKTWISNFRRRW
jgi:FKBP-type peptidyl-prolyl cis-trans isomerase (trigger factor)